MQERKEWEEKYSSRFGSPSTGLRIIIMSKIAKKPVEIKEGAQVNLAGREISVTGPKGTLSFVLPAGVELKIEEGKVFVSQVGQGDKVKALSGLVRANVSNMIKGVTDGFTRKLELSGVGYRAQASGNIITLSVGFSHPVKITADPSISFAVEENIITVSGANKALVGDIASKIRDVRPPEPYKGKGIKYENERIRRKVGKAAKAVGAK
jgi:large subunit ribosomal protein L6